MRRNLRHPFFYGDRQSLAITPPSPDFVDLYGLLPLSFCAKYGGKIEVITKCLLIIFVVVLTSELHRESPDECYRISQTTNDSDFWVHSLDAANTPVGNAFLAPYPNKVLLSIEEASLS